jgi:hypothetical protein
MYESSILFYACRYKNTTHLPARLILFTWAYYLRAAGSVFLLWSGKEDVQEKLGWKGVQAAMTTRNLETDQWRNREEWRLVFGRRRQLSNKQDRQSGGPKESHEICHVSQY